MVLKPGTGSFGTVCRCQVLLENEICISIKLVSSRRHEVHKNFLVYGCVDLGPQKTQWTNTSRWHGTPNHHWLWKLYTDLKQRGFCACPLFLQTLGPWFPKEMQNLLSSENITLDHSAAVQSFLSLAQARRFWRCLLFKSGLTQGMRQLKPMSCIRLCVVVLEALTPAAVHSLWISPTFLNGFCFTILSRVRLSLLLVHFFSTTSFPSLRLSINVLGHRALWTQPLLQWPFVSCPPCARCQWSSFGQLSSPVFTMIV